MKSLEFSPIKVRPEPQAYWKFANSFHESGRRIYWEISIAYSAPTTMPTVKRIGSQNSLKNITRLPRDKKQIFQDEIMRPFGTSGCTNTAKTLHLDQAG
jgi:hypothetical protein